MTGSLHHAADLTQLAFCKAIDGWDRFQHQSSPTTWLHRILMNCIRDWARRNAVREVESLDEWAPRVIPAQGETAPQQVQKNEELEFLRKAIANLSDGVREAFTATVLDGYAYEDAAQLLNVPVGTIASRVYAARKQIHAVMRQAFPEV